VIFIVAKMYTAQTPILKCWADENGVLLYWQKTGMWAFQNILPTAGPMFGRRCRHSSCRQPTFDLPAPTCQHRSICWFTRI